jgi:dynein heavy chain 2
LSTLVDRLPEITIDIVIRNNNISFRPELENARARFYKEVRKFAQIPYNFRGLGDEKDLFGMIGTQNAHLLIPTIQRGEEIFKEVFKYRNQYVEWVYPAQVDIEKIFLSLNTAEEYEDALRETKLKGKQLDRLENEVKIGCVLISLTTLKRQAEALLQTCYTGICSAIQTKVVANSKVII